MNVFMNFTSMLLRLALAGVFGFAAVVKLMDPQAFMLSIDSFGILPSHVVKPMGFFLPWIEIVCAVLLLIGWRSRPAGLVLWGVLMVFIGAILSALFRGLVLECGCFGKFSLMCEPGAIGLCSVYQNCLLASASVVVLFWGPGYLSIDDPAGRPRADVDGALDDLDG